jgi:CRP-like cAMP-binding protein
MTPEIAVAKFLLDLTDRRGARLDMSMSRREMADHLGLTVEMACRVLSRFAETRIIAIPDIYQIEIVDRPALEAVGGADR